MTTRKRHAEQLRELGWHELADLLEQHGETYVRALVDRRAEPGTERRGEVTGAPYERETLRAILDDDDAALAAANESPPPSPRRWTFGYDRFAAFPYIVWDGDGTLRAMFWVRGDAARYVRERNRALGIEPADIGESEPCS